jgi:hypothetical protein
MKTKTNKTTDAFLLSSIFTTAILKLPTNKIDPYSRATTGLIAAAAAILFLPDKNKTMAYVGLGIFAGSGLQLSEILNGGKLTFNKSPGPVFVLSENLGVIQLAPNQVPNYNIDGIAIPGTGKVFKVCNGVYAGVNANSSIYTYGVGTIVNGIRKAGYMNKAWVQQQSDTRWKELYNASI